MLATEEGQNIAKALGSNKAALLQNHGLLTVGQSIEETVFWFVSLEKCCHAQLLADAAAAGRGTPTIKVDHETAQYTFRIYTDEMEYCMFQSSFEDVVRGSNGELPMHVDGEIPRLMGEKEENQRDGEIVF